MKLWRIPTEAEEYSIVGGAAYILADTAEEAVSRLQSHIAAYDENDRRWRAEGYTGLHPNNFPGGWLRGDYARIECIESGFYIHEDCIE